MHPEYHVKLWCQRSQIVQLSPSPLPFCLVCRIPRSPLLSPSQQIAWTTRRTASASASASPSFTLLCALSVHHQLLQNPLHVLVLPIAIAIAVVVAFVQVQKVRRLRANRNANRRLLLRSSRRHLRQPLQPPSPGLPFQRHARRVDGKLVDVAVELVRVARDTDLGVRNWCGVVDIFVLKHKFLARRQNIIGSDGGWIARS